MRRSLLDELRRLTPGLIYQETDFSTSDATLRVVRFAAPGPPRQREILFVPGWASTPYTWRKVIPSLCAYGPVHYLETREKATSRLTGRASLQVPTLAADIAAYVAEHLQGARYAMIAASTGSNLAIEAWSHLQPKPRWLVLLLPHHRIPIPWYASLLRAVPPPLLPSLKPVFTTFVRAGRLTRREASRLEGLFETLSLADLRKLRRSAVAWRRYELDVRKVSAIDRPTLVIGASNDPLHEYEAAMRIRAHIPSADGFDVGSFLIAHGSRVASRILDWAATKELAT
jgi:alpha-beta hydrolase superfamily lysophospholipase